MLVRYRGLNNKGVLERPWTKWMVLRAISSTLKCQFTGKCWKVDFPMPCKTKSCQSSTECLRMLRALPPDTLDLTNFNLNYQKNSFCEKLYFSRFTNRSLGKSIDIHENPEFKWGENLGDQKPRPLLLLHCWASNSLETCSSAPYWCLKKAAQRG